MISRDRLGTFLDHIAELFSQDSQSDMLAFLVKRRQERSYQGPRESWVQCEIARKFCSLPWNFTFEDVKKRDCDFIIENIGIELKVSTSFSYKGKHELFDAIRRQHKNADCWMLITKYDEAKGHKMSSDLNEEFSNLEMTLKMIPRTEWCAILVTRKQPFSPSARGAGSKAG